MYAPYTSLSTDTQTMTTSFILNLNVQRSGNYGEQPVILDTTFYIPNVTSDDINEVTVSIRVKDNATTGGFDLQSSLAYDGEEETHTIASNLTCNIWNRLGIELPLTWSRVSNTWNCRNMYSRVASYFIPNTSVLDGTQKLSLTKVFPTSGSYQETNLTQTIDLSLLGNVDTNNLTT